MKTTPKTTTSHYCRNFFSAFVVFFLAYIGAGPAQTSTGNASGSQTTTSDRDGQHDFDFALGTWKAHLKRLERPLTGSNTWVEFDGTFVARKVWDGRATLEEVELDSPGGHIEGLTLRSTTLKPTSGASIGPTAKMASWTPVPKSVNSRTDTASFMEQTH